MRKYIFDFFDWTVMKVFKANDECKLKMLKIQAEPRAKPCKKVSAPQPLIYCTRRIILLRETRVEARLDC